MAMSDDDVRAVLTARGWVAEKFDAWDEGIEAWSWTGPDDEEANFSEWWKNHGTQQGDPPFALGDWSDPSAIPDDLRAYVQTPWVAREPA
jgi:hypothetical protein